MEEIKDKSKDKNIEPINAIINKNTIIPGQVGKAVDILASYNNMKRINQYNENMLILKDVEPDISIKNNYDKYIISGLKNKKEVSIILLIKDNIDITYFRKLAKDKNIYFNFFIDNVFFENNNELLTTLIMEGHNIGNLSLNGNYSDSNYIWMDTILKKIIKQKNNYCYLENENSEYLNICALNKNYTIKPNIVLKQNPAINIQKSLENGSIISIEVNNSIINEFAVMINYIQSKGYKIVSLNDLLDEK